MTLTGSEAKHMHVMRIEEGEKCELVNGKGDLCIVAVSKKSAHAITVEIESVHKEKKPKSSFHLALGLQKSSHLELAIEKGVELGVFSFSLFPADQSEKKEIKEHALCRLQTITISAMKQSGRLFLPKISFYSSLEEIPSFSGERYFGDIKKEAPWFLPPKGDSLLFFIGPEKGWSKKEISFLENRVQAKGVKLSRHILRAETAAICAAVLGGYFLQAPPL